MPITIDISAGISGTWSIQDDGTPGNATSQVRDPNGNVFQTFAHPADQLTFLSRAGQSFNVAFVDGFAATSITIGSLTSASVRPDNIAVGAILTSGAVNLAANQAITELGADAAVDVGAGDLRLLVGTGIGTSGNPLEIDVTRLEGESAAGGIYLNSRNPDGVTIGGSTAVLGGLVTAASGDISLVARGGITLFEDNGAWAVNSAGNIALTAVGAGADINGAINNDSLRAVGNIALSAGRDVRFGVTGSNFDNDVTAGGSIAITAGRDFHIDGNAEMAANDLGTNSNGGITVSAGRHVRIDDASGTGANLGVTAGTGSVTLTTGTDGMFTLAANSPTALHAAAGNVTVNADRMLIERDSGITLSGSGAVHLTTATAGRWIELGPTDDALPNMKLSDAELGRVFADNLVIGSASIGQLIVNVGAVSLANDNVTLEAGLSIQLLQSLSSAASLTLRAGEDVVQSVGTISTGTLSVFVDTPDQDVAGGLSDFAGTVSVTSSTITGNADADQLGGTAADDTVWAGGGADLIRLNQGGDDTAMGEGGNDRFVFGARLTAADSAIGGAGTDSVILAGNYSLTMGANTLQGIEILRLLTGGGNFDYAITMNDGNVASGQSLTIDAAGLAAGESLVCIGLAETDGSFVVDSGAGDDTLIGGRRNDELNGGGGSDTLFGFVGDDILFGGAGGDSLTGGRGRDTLLYTAPAESTSQGFDQLNRFQPDRDSIDLPVAVTGWSGGVNGGTLNAATFDSDLATAINGVLQPNSAAHFTPNAGDYAGRFFAVVDADGDGNYIAGADYVFEFTAPVQPPEMTAAYFI